MVTVTPAQLAIELQVASNRIRDYLQALHGALPKNEDGWQLDDEQLGRVRARFGEVTPEGPLAWVLEPGDTVRRRSVHEAYGGQEQGGISTPRSVPEILIFTDPDAGAQFGYDRFEGLREDGSYAYTGEGQYGPQVFARGNRALREAAREGKSIRLFRTSGTSATYVGKFTTGTPTYTIETIPDANRNPALRS